MAKSGYNTCKGVLVKRRILNELRKNEERVTFFVRDPLCGWTMGFEPTTTGTTIRGSTAELRPPLARALAAGEYTDFEEECKTKNRN